MKQLLFYILLIASYSLFSQEDKYVFGKFSEEEINLKTCSNDSLANSVILFDIGESKFEKYHDNFDIRFKRHRRIKILKDSEDNPTEVSISLYHDKIGNKERLVKLKACTYNVINNKIINQYVEKSNVFEEKINDNWDQKKFVFPNVKAGSIIEFEYEIVSPFKYNLVNWEFQNKIPTLYSEYKVHMVPFYEYATSRQAIDKFDIETSIKSKKSFTNFGITYKNYTHTFALNNVEAFKNENYITSSNDYVKKIKFQLSKVIQPSGQVKKITSTWKALRKDLLEHNLFGTYLKRSNKIAKKILAEEIDITGLSEEEKLIKLVDYVKNSFHWNGNYSKYSNVSAKQFYKTKTGSSASINLFLTALLNEAGIEATPTIISTRDHGKINFSYPFSSLLNNVIVFVKTETSFLTDGTLKELKYNLIPTKCINDYGLLVNKSQEDNWINIKYNLPSLEQILIQSEIDLSSKKIKSSINTRNTDFIAQKFRSKFLNDSLKVKKYYSDEFDVIKNIKIKNSDNTLKSFEYSLKVEKELNELDEFLIFKPYMSFPINENLLVEEERSYPVDFIYPSKKQFIINISIPELYEIVEMPESLFKDNELVYIRSSYNMLSEYKLQIVSSYEFKKGVYEPGLYHELVKNIDLIVKEFNQEIYLKKKSN